MLTKLILNWTRLAVVVIWEITNDFLDFDVIYIVNNYMRVTGISTGENFVFFIYRHCPEI